MPTFRLLTTSRGLHAAALSFGLITWIGNPAAAVLTWQNLATGDWFTGTNWDAGGNIPGVGDTALILNGGTAQAGLSVNPGNLTVGSTSNTVAASGSLDVTSGDLALNGLLQVGNTTSAATGTSATGSVNVAGAISGATGNLLVGSNQGLGSSASGTIEADSYSGTHGVLGIGRDDKGGSGTGSLVVTNQLALAGKVSFFEVGHIFGDGLVADGELRAGSGDVLTGLSAIGTNNGSQATAGNVSGVVNLGTGSLFSDQNGLLSVGQLSANRSGTAIGELNSAGLSGFGSQRIGVADGGTSGMATGALVVGAGGIAGGSLSIGTTSGAASATGSAKSDGSVTLTSSLIVGQNAGGTGSTANGALRITNGDLLVGGAITLGQVSGPDAGKQAIATLDLVNSQLAARRVGIGQATGTGSTDARMTLQGVTGNIQSLQVGESFDAQGNPNGRVELLGSVLNAEEFVAVGSGLFGGSGNGAISLKDSRLNVGVGPDLGAFYGDMFVGTSGIGSNAKLTLERSLVDVTERLLLGAVSQLEIGIGGSLRIAEYGAIDTLTAVLGGDLKLLFDFTPFLDSMVFDLVVSELLDGISGDFANVSILGLDAAYSAVTGVEIVNYGGADVEVYRLRIARNAVPEPATVFLMLLALGAIVVSRAVQGKGFKNVT